MRQTRGLWASIVLVAVLIVASATGFLTGYLKPKLGLDLEGGVSVILQAPANTDPGVMVQALENIRSRVDAFGVGEPLIAVSGNTIDVEIPGGANGTVEQHQKLQYCLVGAERHELRMRAGSSDGRQGAQGSRGDAVAVAGLRGRSEGTQLACFGSQQEADTYKTGLTVAKKSTAPPPSPSSRPRPAFGVTERLALAQSLSAARP